MKTISLFLFSFILACSNGGNSNAISAPPSPAGEVLEDQAYSEESMVQQKRTVTQEQEQKIIKTARLAFETPSPEETHQKILKLTSQYEGFVANDNSGKSYNRIFRNMTVRVPTKNFQAFINSVSEGVEYFDQRDISRQDVTEEFVDLQARLKAKRKLEDRYLELLSKAKNVKEMLEIERELSNIREEIEAKEGRLKYLQNRVSVSTINLEFYKYTAESGVTVSYGQKIKNALQGGWNGVSVFFLGLLYLWPLFIVVIIVLLVVRWLVRRNRKK
ncbi:DUF4349 domain-containing protein [Marixanthomonas ophiurae]|uniref:DUF4349 domain-containing protein n=1 Tax=Marixanthomonas ophiurae TaxID=387659 RepID=A0A3E1QAR2_9FLAO|nr:DUF4349 domain-containing protein [Marixanthomonas ophiurae]RFN59206.1 DUF4349 domain-containing protein [Marixanthomonas ophiurae]